MKVAVRFADLAGNNRADYLCIASDGIVSGYLQQGSGVFVDVGQIKSAIGTDQANLRWADVDGDEKNDMLWNRPLVWTTIRITILLQFVQDSLARYDEIMASSYDKYFKIYTDYLVSNSWSALRSFLLKRGDEYFTCKTTEETTCCNTILNKALGDAKPLIDQLSAPLFEIQAMSLEADPEDIVDSVSMSILLIRDSVAFLENVVEMGKQLEEADKRSFILNLLSPIFLVVSMGGSTLTSAGLTSLGRAFVAIGEGAGIGLEIYDMVQTPSATPLDLFGILFSVKGI
ncbi:hypothetical protein K4K61_009423 [Colletotrichum sp. SAR11_59]|nr:hypothetical protein K4K61_009423 [Colletotrichum sp. SAR11_59]